MGGQTPSVVQEYFHAGQGQSWDCWTKEQEAMYWQEGGWSSNGSRPL